MNVEDILRAKQARLISMRLNESVRVAAHLLHREGIGAVVVQDVCHTEGNTIVGMFSERDLVRVLAERGPAVFEKQVANFITGQVYTCAPRDTTEKALGLMLKHHVRHLPVLDNFTLIGVISMRDIAALIAAHETDTQRLETDRLESLSAIS